MQYAASPRLTSQHGQQGTASRPTRSMGESIGEFMDRRRREIAQGGRKAESIAHEAYGRATRTGQDLTLRSPRDVVRHGTKLLQEKASRGGAAGFDVIRATRRHAGEALSRASEDPAVRAAAVGLARRAGNVTAVVRGAVHAAEGLANGAAFMGRLLSPLDPLISPEGEVAFDQLDRSARSAGRKTVDYVRQGIADPYGVVTDIREVGQKWRRDLDPSATPTASTFKGELRRNFDIGQNQGEFAFEAGSLAVGGPLAKSMRGINRGANVGNTEKYLAQGFSQPAAAHLAKVYPETNMGHHFIRRAYRLPDLLGGGPLPRSYSDGPFNKLSPPGISRGDFYELHYAVDPKFWGGTLLKEGWSGKKLGLRKYGLAGRIWNGSPGPLKARVGGLTAAAGGGFHDLEEGKPRW